MRSDPIGLCAEESKINEENYLYLYAEGNPSNFIDPYGLLPIDPRCWWATWKAKRACGEKYHDAVKQTHEYIDWCGKAWWYCFTNGKFVPKRRELPCDKRPSKDECKKFKKYNSESDARKSCMNSPQFKKFVGQAAKCVKAVIKAGKKCLWL